MAKTTKKTVRASKVASSAASTVGATEGTKTAVAAATSKTATTPKVAPSSTVTATSPIADRVTQALAYIQMASSILALNAPALTTKQRRALGTMRKGGEKFIPQLAQIAQQWSVQIRTQPIAAMTSATELASALQPLTPVLAGLMQEIQDTGAQAQGSSWSTASALYAVLKRMSRKDPKLKAQLAPVAQFFAARRPVTTEATTATTAKPGKEARRKEKEVTAAEELVAETNGAAAAPAGNGASGASGASTAPVVAAASVPHA